MDVDLYFRLTGLSCSVSIRLVQHTYEKTRSNNQAGPERVVPMKILETGQEVYFRIVQSPRHRREGEIRSGTFQKAGSFTE